MSAQINLFHPRYLRQSDLLTLNRVALLAGVVFALLATAGGGLRYQADQRSRAAAVVGAELEALRAEVEAATNANVARKPDPRLSEEIDRTRDSLRRRSEILRLLDTGAVGSTEGFSEYFRGLARQVPDGLWLTGFAIGQGGAEMEIRGAVLNPAAVPDYIRRLGTETAFKGRQFSSLAMNRGQAATSSSAAVAATQVLARPAVPQATEFVLSPGPVTAKDKKP